MQNLIPLEKRTVLRIVRSQYLDHVERKGILPTLKILALVVAGALLAVSWSYPEAARVAFSTLYNMENHILPKAIGVLAAFLASPVIFEHARYVLSSLNKKTPHESLGGVPLVEIVGYIFDNGNFPREEVCNTFAISRSQYTEIKDVLDYHNILVRGENNGRVLNTLMTRETIVDILLGGEKAKYGNLIGRTFDFFAGVYEKIKTSLPSRTPGRRFELRKLEKTFAGVE